MAAALALHPCRHDRPGVDLPEGGPDADEGFQCQWCGAPDEHCQEKSSHGRAIGTPDEFGLLLLGPETRPTSAQVSLPGSPPIHTSSASENGGSKSSGHRPLVSGMPWPAALRQAGDDANGVASLPGAKTTTSTTGPPPANKHQSQRGFDQTDNTIGKHVRLMPLVMGLAVTGAMVVIVTLAALPGPVQAQEASR